jgi:hypothetical protein
MWPDFDPLSPDELLCDLLRQRGHGWIVDEWNTLTLSDREGGEEIIVDTKCTLVEAGRTRALHFFAHASGSTLYRLPTPFFERAGFDWLSGPLHALLFGVPVTLDGASILLDRSAAEKWLGSASSGVRPEVNGRPTSLAAKPVPISKLKAWASAIEDADEISIDVLWSMAKQCFPQNHVSREKVRAMFPGRKRGPKPLSGEVAAE